MDEGSTSLSVGQRRWQWAILVCVLLAGPLMFIATRLYPGGSLADSQSIGFDWTKNFFSNLFLEKALNGADNPGRPWALVGIAIHSLGEGFFFLYMSRVIAHKHAALVLKVVGYANILFNFLIATPLHDAAVTISSTLSLLGLFYITMFVLRSRLHVLKACCIACMLVFYYTLFLYGTGDWGLLAVMQKVSAGCSTLLVLALTFFTGKEHFASRGDRPIAAPARMP
ncbi:MAG: hypothetical protein IT230_12360 [Flavobacteriales bacterium]|nr:hypothetical protein [Flavobacteriales bacterium]